MTPKEQAQDLVKKFLTKQCALNVVDEILAVLKEMPDTILVRFHTMICYQVKQEIEKLPT